MQFFNKNTIVTSVVLSSFPSIVCFTNSILSVFCVMLQHQRVGWPRQAGGGGGAGWVRQVIARVCRARRDEEATGKRQRRREFA